MSQPATPAATIGIVSDVVCPWCWVGKRNLDTALAQLADEGLTFARYWRPFRLNPDMPAGGMDRAEYRRQKFGSVERGRELDARLAQTGSAVGLDFQFEKITRSPATLDAHRLIRLAEPSGRQAELVEALFAAYFNQGRDIGDRAVLAQIAGEAGLDQEAAAAFLDSEEAAEAVAAEDMAYRRAGISGVPSFLIDRYLLTSGAVPADDLADMLRQGVAALRAKAAAPA
jgi:predicted DsbA family dithiol-disulfide isomerase